MRKENIKEHLAIIEKHTKAISKLITPTKKPSYSQAKEKQKEFMIRFLTAGDMPRTTESYVGYTIRISVKENTISVGLAAEPILLAASAHYITPDNQFSTIDKAQEWIKQEGGEKEVYRKLLRGWPK